MGYDAFSKQNPQIQYSMWIWRLCCYMLVYVHCQTNMSEAGHASVLWKKLDSAPSRGHKVVLNRCFFACALLVCCFSSSLFFTRTCAINQINKLPTLKLVRKLPLSNTQSFHWPLWTLVFQLLLHWSMFMLICDQQFLRERVSRVFMGHIYNKECNQYDG